MPRLACVAAQPLPPSQSKGHQHPVASALPPCSPAPAALSSLRCTSRASSTALAGAGSSSPGPCAPSRNACAAQGKAHTNPQPPAPPPAPPTAEELARLSAAPCVPGVAAPCRRRAQRAAAGRPAAPAPPRRPPAAAWAWRCATAAAARRRRPPGTRAAGPIPAAAGATRATPSLSLACVTARGAARMLRGA